MRIKLIVFALSLALASIGAAQSPEQQGEEDVRGAFLTTRPKATVKSGNTDPRPRPSRRRPKLSVVTPANPTAPPGTVVKNKDGAPPAARTPKLGLGLTLFKPDSHGLSVRVDPSHVFRKGDRVRVLLETNAEGYLYIFNTTDGGKPVMIYPNSELDEGGNYIQSHVPIEIPASVAGEERLRWLTFDEHPGAERLFFVFTRQPLPTVPIEDDLISYCRDAANKCPVQPAADVWAKIQTELDSPLQTTVAQRFGRAQTEAEQTASTRGIGLSKDDPEPSVVIMTASSNPAMLVATLDLVHK